MYRYIAKIVQLGSNNDQCYIQNRVVTNHVIKRSRCIYIFIAIALDENIFLDVLHFPIKNIKSHDLEATPMRGVTSKQASDVVCLLLLA